MQSTAGLQPEIKHEESNVKNDSSDDDDEDEDEDEDEEDDIQRLIGPSSPSFKIYCTEADKIKEEELHDSKAHRFNIQFLASRYITGLNQTFE